MVGRNDPCPCGSGKKYKKCCERVITFSSAEKARELRDSRLKNELLLNLNQWFLARCSPEMQLEWADRFKKLLRFPLDQPIPRDFFFSFRFWLLFDAPCLNRKRPVESWMSTIRNAPAKERLARNFCNAPFTCYEIKEIREEGMLFRSLIDDVEYEVKKGETVPREKLVFTRLIRMGNRYELFGPYTSFVHEMRGEILVQLEKYTHQRDEHQDFTARENGWRVLGWSIQRAKELEKMEKLASSPPEILESMKETPFWGTMEPKGEDQVLPGRIMQHLEQFFVSHVARLQKGTQAFYSRSLDLLYKYLSIRYGQSFDWSVLNEDALVHFLSFWYLDHTKTSPNGSKIFLNTLKHLFRWLEAEGITDVYQTFKKVYVLLIRSLPTTVEAKNWIKENAIVPEYRGSSGGEPSGMYMLAVSSTGPVLFVEDKWVPVHLLGFPDIYADNRFWVRGCIEVKSSGCYFTKVEGVYPMILIDKQLQVLGQK
ncbi:YecA family protein [Paenactinomyces guangxiensis]|uniref:SEC-C metal-binding domain-containing protein n=1 Tax=Paenactinomyces guangxiensis TaxID=1490290 RepID=UPI001E6386E4|nr:SEC-C metal-binding domain-containing protein [Paenactinomyces guangxiensis]